MNIEVRKILELINNDNYECYIVGGYIRDYILGINSKDYDICTNAPLDRLKYILRNYKYNIQFNTININIKDINIDITPYRREFVYYKRKPIKYEFTNKLQDDMQRRDFTINSICMDCNGNIVDLLNGRLDIYNKQIKCIENIDRKLIEDPLRILRAIRFKVYLNFNIEKNLEIGIKKYGYLLKDLSYEIKKRELDKIIKYKGLNIIHEYNLDKYLDIDLSNIKYYKYEILTWMNIDYLNKYCITRSDKKTIKLVKELSKKALSKYNIYLYGLNIALLVGELYNIDLCSIYYDLPIKSRRDIDIRSEDILLIVKDSRQINDVYVILEKLILTDKLKNKKDEITKYLLETYGKI